MQKTGFARPGPVGRALAYLMQLAVPGHLFWDDLQIWDVERQ